MNRAGDVENRGERRGLSSVVGTSLLLVIVLLLASMTGMMSMGFTSALGDSAAVFGSGQGIQVTLNGNETTHEFEMVHRSGDPVPVDRLSVVVRGADGTSRHSLSATGDLADGVWSSGDRVRLELDAEDVCAGSPDSVEVLLVEQTGPERSFVVSSKTVSVVPGGFVITEGAVEPTVDYSAEVELLGSAFTEGAGGPDIPISVEVGVGTDSYTPWPGDINDGANPRTTSYADRSAGEGIVVTATGQSYGGYTSHTVDSASDAGTFVHVLRNGSDAPDVEGFGDQSNAEEYVRDYVENGTIVLDDNQAIYLFELSHSTTGSQADYQDVVVLVSLETTEDTVDVREHNGQNVVVCPASA